MLLVSRLSIFRTRTRDPDEKEKNKKEMEVFEEKLKESEKTEGETEIADILRGKAMYLAKIGDKVGFS